MPTMTPRERWESRIDAIILAVAPEWGLERVKARRELAALERERAAPNGQPAGWSPSLRPMPDPTNDDAYTMLRARRPRAQRRPWLRSLMR